jgi:hypothetical protein
MMSKIADDVYQTLKELFPLNYIEKEYYVFYKGTKLFFDFYIPSLSLLFEVQGMQHFKFIRHLHGSIENFRGQKKRDNLKIEYCEINHLTLTKFYDTVDTITKQLVLNRILDAQNNN